MVKILRDVLRLSRIIHTGLTGHFKFYVYIVHENNDLSPDLLVPKAG